MSDLPRLKDDKPDERYGRTIMSDKAMLERFHSAKKRPRSSETLGMYLKSVHQETLSLEMEFEVSEAFTNPSGAVQGGFLSAMLDEAMSTSVIVASNVTMNAPTLEMKTSFLAPLFPGKAIGKAKIVKWGKSICFMEGELFDPKGKMVAKATATGAPKSFMRFKS